MQRGVGNVNPMKMARCIVELERIYGIQRGGDRGNQYKEANPNYLGLKTQQNLAQQIHITDEQLRNYKKLNDLIPELQQLVEKNELKSTVAYKICKILK